MRTVYEVATRYTVDSDTAARKFDEMAKRAEKVDRASSRMTSSLGAGSSKLSGFGASLLPIGGALGLFAAGVGIVTKSMQELNRVAEVSNNMAARFNAAFKFSADPIENFNASMGHSRDLIAGLTKDAAKLPGTASDFYGIASTLSQPVFEAGGDPAFLRQLTAKTALFGKGIGQSAGDSGNQAMRMLFGTASVGDNPIFAALMPTLRKMGVKDVESFNKMDAAKQMHLLSDAMGEFTDNPIFRENLIRTLDTQFGSLYENVFGADGVFGRAVDSGLPLFLDGMIALNSFLETNGKMLSMIFGGTPLDAKGNDIRDYLKTSGAGGGGGGGGGGGVRDWLMDEAQKGAKADLIAQKAANIYAAKTGGGFLARLEGNILSDQGIAGLIYGQTSRGRKRKAEMEAAEKRAAELYEMQLSPEALEKKKKNRDKQMEDAKNEAAKNRAGAMDRAVGSSNIRQTIINNIKLDLKSDDSPDSIAVKMRKAMEKTVRHPTTSQRMASMLPHRGISGL